MVEVDLRTAVFPVPLSCKSTQNEMQIDPTCSDYTEVIHHILASSMSPEIFHPPVSDWFAICCLTLSGDDDLGGALL